MQADVVGAHLVAQPARSGVDEHRHLPLGQPVRLRRHGGRAPHPPLRPRRSDCPTRSCRAGRGRAAWPAPRRPRDPLPRGRHRPRCEPGRPRSPGPARAGSGSPRAAPDRGPPASNRSRGLAYPPDGMLRLSSWTRLSSRGATVACDRLEVSSRTPQLMSYPTPPGEMTPSATRVAATPPTGKPYPSCMSGMP